MITNEYMERLRVDAEGLSHPMNQHLYNTATASLADIAADDFSIPRSVRAVLCHAMIAGHLAHTATQPGFSWLLEQAEIQIRAATAAFNDVEEDNESIAEMFSVVLAAAIKSAEEEVANSMELLKEGEK